MLDIVNKYYLWKSDYALLTILTPNYVFESDRSPGPDVIITELNKYGGYDLLYRLLDLIKKTPSYDTSYLRRYTKNVVGRMSRTTENLA